MESGQQITVDMQSDDFDALLELYGPDNRRLAENDDGGEGRNARLTYTANASGQYRAVATEWAADVFVVGGSYRIRVNVQ